MSTNKKSNEMDLIAKDMEKAAKAAKVPAYSLTKSQYFANDPKFKEWNLRKYGGFIAIRNTYFESTEIREESKVAALTELRTEFRKLRKDSGDVDLLLEKVKEAVSGMPALKLKPYKPSKLVKKSDRTLNLLLSDLHFGSDLSTETGNKRYGKVEEARALATVVNNVCTYKMQYRDTTELVVCILGDVIEGALHGLSSSDMLHIQTCRAMWLLSQAIGRFSESFPSVKIFFCVGNHGRDTSIHPKRATEMKFNALETTVYYGIKLACKHLKNVTFDQPKTPWISYSAQGHRIYGSHGDTGILPGNPGGKIDTKSLEHQTNKLNASLSDSDEYEVVLMGHVHQAMVTALSNGVTLITNGPMVPPNEYAQSLNIQECQQVQVAFESTKEFAVGDFRFINVKDYEDNKELDKIIQPFNGLNYL